MRNTRLRVALALPFCLSVAMVAAQQPTFKSGTQVVSVFTTVTDAQKRLVPDLVQDDFEVLDNEKPQPLILFVMLDTSGSMTLTINLLKQAAEEFVARLLPADSARIGAFNDKIQFNSRFMNDRDQLATDIRNMDYGNGTRLWDALAASLDELKDIDGRKVILVFTDGDDTESHNSSLGKVIDRARVDEVMIYAIGLESQFFNGAGMVRTKPDKGLRKVADEIGGGYFELTKTSELSSTFTRVAQELHSQYLLAFTPAMLDGKIHKLSVRVKKPGMNARARRSYLAGSDKPAA